ncbi:hypothetical protein JCGZ_11967 [Jatropha curcas]|uniref:Uncharacterized protein n=1 Tax=Jatropha curcas TaxID=180498 RepID=A0A067KS61_JATCU|nr:hypothetical protein JCGZ_11967 [Jatropha curcas]
MEKLLPNDPLAGTDEPQIGAALAPIDCLDRYRNGAQRYRFGPRWHRVPGPSAPSFLLSTPLVA